MELLQNIPLEGLIPGGKDYNNFQPDRFKQLQAVDGLVTYYHNHFLHFYRYTDGTPNLLAKHDVGTYMALFGEGSGYKEDTPLHTIMGQPGCFWLKLKDQIVVADLLTPHINVQIAINPDWEGFDYSPAANRFAYLHENGLFLLDSAGKSTLVYQSEEKAVTAGQTAARDEFGIEKGTYWSNDGEKLAFFITDQRPVTEYPLVDIEKPIATLRNIRYPMAGAASEQTTIGIYHLNTGKTIVIDKQGAPEDYLCCVTFTPDNQQLLAAELTRNQQHCRVNLFDAGTGRFQKTVLQEDDQKYSEPEHTPLFIPGKDDLFIWQSRRNGYNTPYLYSMCNGLVCQLANLDGEVTRIVGYSQQTEQLFFECNAFDCTARSLMAADLEGHLTLLGDTHSTHKGTLLQDGYYIDEMESPTTPYRVTLRQLGNKEGYDLYSSKNPLEGYAVPEVEIGSIRQNGYDISYRLVRPTNYQADQKYPLVCYFYGGPHVQLIRKDWNCGTAGFEYMMAQAGYMVFTIDPRGSANRGKVFEQEIWRNIGGPQIEDYVTAVEWICQQEKIIDSNRIGVYGWSFGGFISTSLMLKVGHLFKVGVAGGPVTNWRLYEVMYTERYMQTPQENPEGYNQHDLTRYVGQLEGKLLLIHCNTDPVVLWQNSLDILQQAVKNDKQIDYAVYVGHPHNVRGPERVHLMKKVRQYFLEWL